MSLCICEDKCRKGAQREHICLCACPEDLRNSKIDSAGMVTRARPAHTTQEYRRALRDNYVLCLTCDREAAALIVEHDCKSFRRDPNGRGTNWVYVVGSVAPFCDSCLLLEAAEYPIVNIELEDGDEALVTTESYIVNQVVTDMRTFEFVPEGAKVLGAECPQATSTWESVPLTVEFAQVLSKHAPVVCDERGGPYVNVMGCMYADYIRHKGMSGWLESFLAPQRFGRLVGSFQWAQWLDEPSSVEEQRKGDASRSSGSDTGL